MGKGMGESKKRNWYQN